MPPFDNRGCCLHRMLTKRANWQIYNERSFQCLQLFDIDVIEKMPDFPKHFPGKLKYRVLPKAYSTNSAIHIFGDYVVTYTGLTVGIISNDIIFFVIKSQSLADSYRTWFDFMWKMSKEIK